MKNTSILTVLAAAAAVASSLPRSDARSLAPTPPDRQPVVQLALLLDTSNSMDGLIDQARTRLWQVVNDLALARHAGRRPRLEVALFEYGNSGLSRESGFIREVSGFTDDLDRISSELFALRTNGGSEFCGAVIERAVERLAWSGRPEDLELVFIAGNEPFTQGPVDYRDAVRGAVARGITVNTIHCGSEANGVSGMWKDGALLADGMFACIDQNQRLPQIDAPQDRELAALNARLNSTYIAYGESGRERAEMQARQDAHAAAAAPSSIAQRITAKASSLYRNTSWDLVDAVKEGKVEVSELEADELPVAFRELTPEQRVEKIEAAAAERGEIQARIQALGKEREAYVADAIAKLPSSPAALDQAMRQSVRAQAAKKDYVFEGK